MTTCPECDGDLEEYDGGLICHYCSVFIDSEQIKESKYIDQLTDVSSFNYDSHYQEEANNWFYDIDESLELDSYAKQLDGVECIDESAGFGSTFLSVSNDDLYDTDLEDSDLEDRDNN
ncbi:MAG: hypothetical protein Q8S55_11740 [Methylococcaceae bacterium]|nr:hypothetical protein [Methylococcaceae bacterium]